MNRTLKIPTKILDSGRNLLNKDLVMQFCGERKQFPFESLDPKICPQRLWLERDFRKLTGCRSWEEFSRLFPSNVSALVA